MPGSASRAATAPATWSPGSARPAPGLMLDPVGRGRGHSRDEGGRRSHIVTHERGNFLGELAQLSGRPYLVDAQALTDVEAIAIPPDGCARC